MIAIGKAAPAFSSPDQDGTKRTLAEFRGKWVVLYFYPRDDTPGCTVEACEFTEGVRGFTKLDAQVLGCSPDTPEKHKKFIEKYKLPFSLLADEDLKVLKAYEAWGERSMYGRKFMGILRKTYVIGADGKIKAIFPKVKPAGHEKEVLEALG